MITPLKLRAAVLRARAEGRSYDDVAALLGIGRATVNRILRLHRETNSLEPRPRGGGNVSPIHDGVAELLISIVAETPDATVVELAEMLMQRSGITTSRSAVTRALARLKFSRKKSPSSQRSATRRRISNAAMNSARS